MRILLVIPAFNEEMNIGKLLDKLIKLPYDIVVINDSSKDRTKEIVKSYKTVKLINLSLNLGIGGAVQTGFKYAYYNNYDIVVQVDGDGQHNPEFINDLISPIKKNIADLVIGSRFIKKEGFQSSFIRRIGIKIFQILNIILIGKSIRDSTSGFRAINKKVLKILKDNYATDFPEPESIVLLNKYDIKISEIPVIMNIREKGSSSISGFKSIYYMIKVIISMIVEHLRRK